MIFGLIKNNTDWHSFIDEHYFQTEEEACEFFFYYYFSLYKNRTISIFRNSSIFYISRSFYSTIVF
ncbi:hypothetical protein RN87_06505 [Fusobacterium hwasookii ChDC F174]|uniref:Uncharacterized protein n=2 Tax=Fusobacterium hwasookii TaxID=1583098 RepID=A0A0S2ZN14_9FUSO|nr:hypothetical protein [Fusobacterium hwasookii]ALQ40182.1 hypothetical protein RN87_06505 [Fusobacterium hwasookii ChDC F174]EJU08653.1 hypothetical protein B437_00945 [Fusobacterium hwasookii ChDC F128]